MSAFEDAREYLEGAIGLTVEGKGVLCCPLTLVPCPLSLASLFALGPSNGYAGNYQRGCDEPASDPADRKRSHARWGCALRLCQRGAAARWLYDQTRRRPRRIWRGLLRRERWRKRSGAEARAPQSGHRNS